MDIQLPELEVFLPNPNADVCVGDTVSFGASLTCGDVNAITWTGDVNGSGDTAQVSIDDCQSRTFTATATLTWQGVTVGPVSNSFTFNGCQYDCDGDGIMDSCEPCPPPDDPPDDPITAELVMDSLACDGEEVPVTIQLSDSSATIDSVSFTATPQDASQVNNVLGKTMNFVQDGSMSEWKIDNVRWYERDDGPCALFSDYKIKATVTVDGETIVTPEVDFTASTSIINCFKAGASRNESSLVWTGSVNYLVTPVKDENDVIIGYEIRFKDIGTIERTVDFEPNVNVPEDSQFGPYVHAEENFHVAQIEDPEHPVAGVLYNFDNVVNSFKANEPYVADTLPDAIKAADDALDAAAQNETSRSDTLAYSSSSDERCQLESEAKAAIGAPNPFTFECRYAVSCEN